MEDNHIGLVLISGPQGLAGVVTDRDLALAVLGRDIDPDEATLSEIMSEGVISLDISGTVEDVAQLMQKNRVRRIPLTENGQLAGLVTFDDLVLDGSVSIEQLRAIVTAQLEVEAAQKPAGVLYPQRIAQPGRRSRALVRAKLRADEVYNRLVKDIADRAELDFARSERALIISLCMLCHRLVPDEALHLIAQLPSKLQPQLDQCLDGPDRSVSTAAIRNEVAQTLGLDQQQGALVLKAIFAAISNTVSQGQIDEVRGQLPDEMKELFPVAA